MSDIERYVDKAMFPAAPMESVEPEAHLLWMTPDPLGAVAACVRMYKGIPTYSLSEITDDERKRYFDDVFKTELRMPFEAIKMHFFIEGVPRDLTHQMVRQRTAAYAQESLRFAVKEDLAGAVTKPPSLRDPSKSHSTRNDLNDIWDGAIGAVEMAYNTLVQNGVPAEDARGLLPGATLTRLNYITDLRNFQAEAGKRLCTQAQYHWRKLFLSMREAVRTYDPFPSDEPDYVGVVPKNQWQFELIADSQIFSPVCYQIGKCGFKAEFDRGCTIRERVDAFECRAVPSSKWGPDVQMGFMEGPYGETEVMQQIDPAEWLKDPKAGWVQ